MLGCGKIMYCATFRHGKTTMGESEAGNGTIRRRIQFCVEWYHFQFPARNIRPPHVDLNPLIPFVGIFIP